MAEPAKAHLAETPAAVRQPPPDVARAPPAPADARGARNARGAFGVVVRHTEEELVLRHADFPELVTRVPGFEDAATLAALFEASAAKHAGRRALGTRPLLAVHSAERAGKRVERREQGDYTWMSYDEALQSARACGAGLGALGVPRRGVVAIFADTSAHWFLAANASFLEGFVVATVYTSLGARGVEHALSDCGASAVVTDAAGAKVLAATGAAAAAKRVVLLPPRGADAAAVEADAAAAKTVLPPGTPVHTWREVLDAGSSSADAPKDRQPPVASDTALLMFTSGSTGTPKGVLISHAAAVAAVAGMLAWNAHAAAAMAPLATAAADAPGVADAVGDDDVALAYLPLAHIFEFVAETAVALAAGASLGYGHPATLTDAAPGVQRGSKGDTPALRPTFMTAVPTVLERVRSAVDGTLHGLRGAKGLVARAAFGAAFAAGDAALRRCGVYSRGACAAARRPAGLCDALAARLAPRLCAAVFAAPRAALGGRCRFFLSGGAPLSASTQRYLQVVFGCPVLQGYGLTETCCIGTLTSPADTQVGRVGAPVPAGLVKLVPWREGGYTPADQPLPRGEIHLGGPALADGYHNMQEATAADFYMDADGVRWFRTGDIGVVHDDGVLAVVDRRKDLVKLERGEYLSLGKVEAALQTEARLVAHALVLAHGHMRAPVALVAPHTRPLREALGADAPTEGDDDALLRCAAAADAVMHDVRRAGRAAGLESWEVPTKVRLVPGPWTPESGLVTAALKVRRQSVQAAFKVDVDALMREQPAK